MDPETEARLAALLMEEAHRLRQRADKEGVGAYLAKPVVRVRPNPQFMKATVQGVQQANRVVEINEMWRRRSVELDKNYTKRVRRSEEALRGDQSRKAESHSRKHDRDLEYQYSIGEQDGRNVRQKSAVSDPDQAEPQFKESDDDSLQEEGWKDDDMEHFLNSRTKRGRGAVGCRMDEPGPYLAPQSASTSDIRVKEDWEAQVAGHASRAGVGHGQADGLWEHRKQKGKHRENGGGAMEQSGRLKHKKRKEEKREKKREGSKDSKKKDKKRHTG